MGQVARCPLPIAQDMGFLGFWAVAASPARQSAPSYLVVCPSLSPLWPGSLGDCDCSDTVKRTQFKFIHLILPSLPSHNLAESGTVLGHWKPPESRSLRDFPWVSGCQCLDPPSRLPLVTQRHSQQMPVGLLSRLRKDCNVTAPPLSLSA